MSIITGPNCRSFDAINEKLLPLKSVSEVQCDERTRAAVAMILHQAADDLEILFIQRASHDLDPWSGHIAFPGGKMEDGELECQTACRETLEETGIDLQNGRYLGQLSDIVGANLPVRVSCCLFSIDRLGCHPILNEEVKELFWVKLSDLSDPGRHLQSHVAFGDKRFEVPAIKLTDVSKPVLWGITYRLVMQFLSILDGNSPYDEGLNELPELVEIDEEVEHE